MGSGHRVYTALGQGMTATDALRRKPTTFHQPMFLNCLVAVLGTGGHIAT